MPVDAERRVVGVVTRADPLRRGRSGSYEDQRQHDGDDHNEGNQSGEDHLARGLVVSMR
jgi:hypothetical protein